MVSSLGFGSNFNDFKTHLVFDFSTPTNSKNFKLAKKINSLTHDAKGTL